MTDADVIAAIKANHLAASIEWWHKEYQHWDRATVDPGNTIFGKGPYVKLPVGGLGWCGAEGVIRVDDILTTSRIT